jgi:tetratricopeptide (TPR) repeat protein
MMVVILLVWLARAGAAQSIDQTKLREAIKLPEISVTFQFQFHLRDESGDPNDSTVQIAALQKTLRSDPSDAAVYVKIGDLYSTPPLNNDSQGDVAYRKAIPLFRKQLEKQPQNGRIKAQLGSALYETNQYVEAEKVLREAVRLAPHEWRPWADLGACIQHQALLLASGSSKTVPFPIGDFTAIRQALEPLLEKATPEQIAMLQKRSVEAHADFDRAVALNPGSPEPYADRSDFFWLDQTITQNVIKIRQGRTSDTTLFPPEALDDLWKAAGVAPDAPVRQGLSATFEIERGIDAAGDKIDTRQPGNIDRIPAISRDRLHILMERLRKMADGKDPRKAKVAVPVLIYCYLFNGDSTQVEQIAKRTLALDPTSRTAWEALIGVYISMKRYQEIATALEDRLKHEDTPFNRLLLAEVSVKLEKPKLVSEQVFSALQRFPDDLLLNLAAVDVLLKQPEAEALKKAGDSMEHTQTLFAKMSKEDQKTNETNMNLTRGVYLALVGKVPVAKTVIQSVLTDDPDDESAKEIMAILGGSP